MQRFDAHIHLGEGPPAPEALLSRLEAAGFRGGSLISPWPRKPFAGGEAILARAEALLAWTQRHPDRLFPMLFVHPHEPDVIPAVQKAASMGVAGFKFICTDYLPSDTPCMDLLAAIAALDKPVLFHSGILWDGHSTSEGSRPLHFEALLRVPRLRFALAHCAWPWLDECIALYGKFLNAYVTAPEVSSEMFIDLTPGTPEMYRRKLFDRLFHVGYDVPHNLLFGADCSGQDYNDAWTRRWTALDAEILDAFDVPQTLRQWLYRDNLLRFLGKTPKDFTHISPVPDSLTRWTLDMHRG